MVRQEFDIERYWKIIVYYQVDYNRFMGIYKDCLNYKAPAELIEKVYHVMSTGMAKGVTLSMYDHHVSIVLINPHESKFDFVSTVVHEAEHVKQAMLEVYDVKDYGEPPAYTIGYIVMMMYRVFKRFL